MEHELGYSNIFSTKKLVIISIFLIINERTNTGMRRNEKHVYEYRKYRNANHDLEEYEARPKPTEAGLKSLECSSVDEIQPTN